MAKAIDLNNLTFRYHKNQKTIVDISHFTLEQGQRTFLHGPSGSGKSTLLNLLSGVLRPTSGQLDVLGQRFTDMSARAIDHFRARHMGVIFQQFNLIPYLSVRENVMLAEYFAGNPHSDHELNDIFEGLKLSTKLLSERADSLSIGQQQRIAIARALVNAPKLIIADEPTSALDEGTTSEFMSLLIACCEAQNSALLFVSHDSRLAYHFDNQISMTQLQQGFSQPVTSGGI